MKVDPKKVGADSSASVGSAGAAKKSTSLPTNNSNKLGDLLAPDNSSASRVNVSERARDFQKIKEVAMSAPDVDEAKVAKFKSLIESGQYKVDADKIADKLVDEHMAMGGYASDDE